jgi:hypothetical protein
MYDSGWASTFARQCSGTEDDATRSGSLCDHKADPHHPRLDSEKECTALVKHSALHNGHDDAEDNYAHCKGHTAILDPAILREKATRRERIVFQGTVDQSVSVLATQHLGETGQARNSHDTVPTPRGGIRGE